MKIEISSEIKLIPKNNTEKNVIRKLLAQDLVFTNPESNAREINSAYNNLIVCYHFDKDENCFFIPKGRINILNKLSYCKEIEFETLDDLRTVGEDIVDFKCNFDFRDEIQKGAFDAYVNNPAKIGIINLACGLGSF